jgi:hypothetical protein
LSSAFLFGLCVGCFIFFEALENFFKQFFFLVGFASSIKNFGCVSARAVFNCAYKMGRNFKVLLIVFGL